MSEVRVFSARLPVSLIRRIKIYCFDNNIQVKDAALTAMTDWINKMEGVNGDTVSSEQPSSRKKRKLSAKVLRAIEIMKEQPDLSDAEIAKMAGVSRQTVYNKRKEIEEG